MSVDRFAIHEQRRAFLHSGSHRLHLVGGAHQLHLFVGLGLDDAGRVGVGGDREDTLGGADRVGVAADMS